MRFTDKTRRWVAVLGAGGALVAGAFALPALAQDGSSDAGTAAATDDSTAATEGSTSEDPATGPRAHVEERHEALVEALADELGLPVDEVRTALEAAQETVAAEWAEQRQSLLQERLDAAVADGRLTQEQADAIIAAAEEGVIGGPGRDGPGFGQGPRGLGAPNGPWFDGDAPQADAS